MITDTDLYMLARINSGLRSDMHKIHELDTSLQVLLDEVHTYPLPASDAASSDWLALANCFATIRYHIGQVDQILATESGDPRRHWKIIMDRDSKLEALLGRIRDSGSAVLDEAHRLQWDDLWRTICHHLATVETHAAMAVARAEMREHYGEAVTDLMAQEIIRHLPAQSNIADAALYAEEYRKALIEYQARDEKQDSFFDIVKTLFLVQDEDPESVARRRMGEMRRNSDMAVRASAPTIAPP